MSSIGRRPPPSTVSFIHIHVARDLRAAVRGLARGRVAGEWMGLGFAAFFGATAASSSRSLAFGVMLALAEVFAAMTATTRGLRRRFQRESEHEFFAPQTAGALAFVDVARVMTWVALAALVCCGATVGAEALRGASWSARNVLDLLPWAALGGLVALDLALVQAATAHCAWMSNAIALPLLLVLLMGMILAVGAQALPLAAAPLPDGWTRMRALGLAIPLAVDALIALGVALAVHRTANPERTLLEPMRVSPVAAAMLSQPE